MHCCDHDHNHDNDKQAANHANAQPQVVNTGAAQAVLLIQKMDCPTEEKLIRDRFNKMAGIVGMEFNLMQRELTVHHNLPSVA
mgnify:FL=1